MAGNCVYKLFFTTLWILVTFGTECISNTFLFTWYRASNLWSSYFSFQSTWIMCNSYHFYTTLFYFLQHFPLFLNKIIWQCCWWTILGLFRTVPWCQEKLFLVDIIYLISDISDRNKVIRVNKLYMLNLSDWGDKIIILGSPVQSTTSLSDSHNGCNGKIKNVVDPWVTAAAEMRW